MAKVAFLGLGVMGYPMAGHLKNKGGHEVTVYNRNAEKAAKWAAQFGGKTAATPKEAAEGQDFVMMCVGNDNDVREVALGENGAYHGMGKGTVFVDHTTASADVARELHAAAKAAGLGLMIGGNVESLRALTTSACFAAGHGGFGYAKDFHVERLFREAMLPRIAPVSRELILSYIAERVLGQEKSY